MVVAATHVELEQKVALKSNARAWHTDGNAGAGTILTQGTRRGDAEAARRACTTSACCRTALRSA